MSVKTNPECVYPSEKFDRKATDLMRTWASSAVADLRTLDTRLADVKKLSLYEVGCGTTLAAADETGAGGDAVDAPGKVGQWCVGKSAKVIKTVPAADNLEIGCLVIWFAVAEDKWGGVNAAVDNWNYF